MITPAQIKAKAEKIWQSYRLQQAYLTNENLFPLKIPLPTFSAKLIQKDFSSLRSWIKKLVNDSKEFMGSGYQIIFKDINHRQLGQQSLPTHISFSTQDDFLDFVDKKKQYQKFCRCVDNILSKEPKLKTWIMDKPDYIEAYYDKWQQLLNVCNFIRNNPMPQRYLRELEISGINTKFIEQHKKVLSELFEQLLPVHAINHEVTQRGTYYFEQRYGFNHDEQLIRFRILDKNISTNNFHDISIPLSEFKNAALPCRHIFITENKINGLSFPFFNQAIVVFGLGYGIQSLRNITWLKDKNIIYWGDIDTHGFAILSQLRSYYSQTKSLLMDISTFKKYQFLAVPELPDKRCMGQLPHLFPEEQTLYQNLQNNMWGENNRLEQERINFNYLVEYLKLHSEKFFNDCNVLTNII
jgi:hypothetical protein